MLVRLTLLGLALLASGCVSMNRYGTARTLDAGEANTSVTLDVVMGTGPVQTDTDIAALPAPHVRHNRGIADGTELVLDVGLPATLGVDLKRQLVRSHRFDLAVAPGVSGSWVDSREVFTEAHVPLVADLVVAPWLVVVPQVSAGWGLRNVDAGGLRHTPLLGGGAGLYFRTGDRFAIQPMASTTVELDTLYTHYRFGLAFSIGTQPRFE